jgi:hypothetical protein
MVTGEVDGNLVMYLLVGEVEVIHTDHRKCLVEVVVGRALEGFLV